MTQEATQEGFDAEEKRVKLGGIEGAVLDEEKVEKSGEEEKKEVKGVEEGEREKGRQGRRRRNKERKKKEKKGGEVGEEEVNGELEGGRERAEEENGSHTAAALPEKVEVEYLLETPEIETATHLGSEALEHFAKVFESFKLKEKVEKEGEEDKKGGSESEGSDDEEEEEKKKKEEKKGKDREKGWDEAEAGKEGEEDAKNLSNKEKKLRRRLKVSELKQVCPKPDVVEIWDASADDPFLLVFLKSYRNSIPVPRHWSQKRKYLQGKRGIEKPPFQLPDFIAATGIQKLRQAYTEKEESKKLKQKQREKMQPKMGKMDIDYQVLHDAFFKFQTKPKLSSIGELYYEGKEFENKYMDLKPGHLSLSLRNALGLTDSTVPPPWLINMQRYGPPPSYPSLPIPGLNCPIPEGCEFGYQAGGWGKPPVDEFGRPLYGDVFGTQSKKGGEDDFGEVVDKSEHWGDLEEAEEEEEEEEEEREGEEEEEEGGEEGGAQGEEREKRGEKVVEEALQDGMASVETFSTTPAGVETPDVIDLRKGQKKEEKSLYTVLEEKEERVAASALMGSSHTYVVPGTQGKGSGQEKKKGTALPSSSTIEMSLNPEDLETGLDESALAKKYEAAREEERERANVEKEDFSDMVAEAEKKRKRKAQDKDAKAKKHAKDFKF